MIILTHPFLTRCHNLEDLLDDTKKLSSFCNKLIKQSVLFPDRYNPDEYKGDGFEFFVEALLKLHPTDNRIGIGNYQTTTKGTIGVDGFGIGIDGSPATVQCKFKSMSQTYLSTKSVPNLMTFPYHSQNTYGVPLDCKNNMLVITTAIDLHHYTKDEVMLGKVRCLGYNDLRTLVDNNILFWNEFRKAVFNV